MANYLIRAWHRWLAYRRHLSAAMADVLDGGYRVSPPHYARLRREARKAAKREAGD